MPLKMQVIKWHILDVHVHVIIITMIQITWGPLVLYRSPECIGYAEQASKYMTICCINFHPCRSIRKQIWPCHKNGQGQLSVIIWTNLVVPEYPMLYTKFQVYQVSRSSVSWFRRRRFLKVFIICGPGGHLGHVTRNIWTNFHPDIPWRLLMNLASNCLVFFEEKFVCLFVQVLRRFQQFFSHIATVSGCDRELNAHFYSAASLKYHAPDTWHDTTPSHFILTLGQPVLALPRKSECQERSNKYHFEWLWYVAARDRTQDLPFPGADTLPTELSGPVSEEKKF